MLKLSIIIPVYNVEKYVEKCIVSCAEQDSYSSVYEIIVVNDGTKDRSLEIAETVAKRYDNVHITSQSNAGLSAARNKGLSLAKGEYVWFIDSDDWIDANCLNSIIGQLKDIDILLMGHRVIEDDKIIVRSVTDAKVQNGRQLLAYSITYPVSFLAAPFYIYKRSFLEKNKLHFMPGIFHEDYEFTPRMLYYADKLKVCQNIVYNYLNREGSITQSVNPKRSFDMIKIAGILMEFSDTRVDQNDKQSFNNLISLALNNSLNNSLNISADDKKILSDMFLESKFLFSAMKNSSITKYRVEGVLFSLFPCHCLWIYTLLNKIKYSTPVGGINQTHSTY